MEKVSNFDQLKRDLAEMTIRLLVLPASASRDHMVLDEVERMAKQVLWQVAALRSRDTSLPGEKCGVWRIPKITS